MDNHLDILEHTLRLRHMAPTAPDTLGQSRHLATIIRYFGWFAASTFSGFEGRCVV